MAVHRLGHGSIRGQLLLFARQAVTIHKQKLGTEQTHALSTIALGTGTIMQTTDIGAEFHPMAVQSLGWQTFQFAQLRFFGQKDRLLFGQLGQLLSRGIDDKFVINGIEHHTLPVLNTGGHIFRTDNGRKFQ